MGESIGRAAAGVFTLGASEVVSSLTKNAFKSPTPPEAQKPATTSDPGVQQAVAEGAQRRSKARGYRSTILSQNFMSPDSSALKTTFGS